MRNTDDAHPLSLSLTDNGVQQGFIQQIMEVIYPSVDDQYDYANAIAALNKLSTHLEMEMAANLKMTKLQGETLIKRAMTDWEVSNEELDSIISAFALKSWDLDELEEVMDELPDDIQTAIDKMTNASAELRAALAKREHSKNILKQASQI